MSGRLILIHGPRCAYPTKFRRLVLSEFSLRQVATKESLDQWVSVGLGVGTLGRLPVDIIKNLKISIC